jgi:hypothetical protein
MEEALTIRAPSLGAARQLGERLSFTEYELVDGEVQGCRVVVPKPSAEVFNRTLQALSEWLEDSGLASVEVEFDGSSYVVNADTPARLGIE